MNIESYEHLLLIGWLMEMWKCQVGREFGEPKRITYIWWNKSRSREFEMIFLLVRQLRFPLAFTQSEIIPALLCCDNVFQPFRYSLLRYKKTIHIVQEELCSSNLPVTDKQIWMQIVLNILWMCEVGKLHFDDASWGGGLWIGAWNLCRVLSGRASMRGC